ncbi:hypothetical protein DUNSADRAFT_9195 [Dunaliella salina]|uniref:Uncharacterized protein n=1 Tax=Dunaliella salina TaxID=3046 RepID=A0ABQ7GI13_DUNSA|nr:hypothetical protein DUNSADRAFT_9195 [Dunaliella salina]|eukprot:KAF5834242.1 hypothetical protein DUNSADRAFT_9195 [Dunaliella salina]
MQLTVRVTRTFCSFHDLCLQRFPWCFTLLQQASITAALHSCLCAYFFFSSRRFSPSQFFHETTLVTNMQL